MAQSDQRPTSTTSVKSLSEFVSTNAPATLLTACHRDLIKEVQEALKIEADGFIGPITRQAFAEFKLANQLDFSLELSVATAKELLALQGQEEEASLEEDLNREPKLNVNAGSRTGRSMQLPAGTLVYANQFVIEGIPLTWGELTKDCTRVPTAKEYVDNAIKLARVWGEVRAKFGSPIRITSGYRPPAVNRAVKGASNSQHLYFRAIDMQPLNGDFKKLWQVLEASKFTGLGDAVFRGRNKGFFHGDIRPGSRIIFDY